MASTAGEEPATLQSRLEDGATPCPDATIGDPVALLHHLDVSGHFHRDGRSGRLFHLGMVSLRENVETDSLHISIDGNRVAAHVDAVSPLAAEADGPSRYSVRRALSHNLTGMAMDLMWLLRGRQGDHSSVLNCEWYSLDGAAAPLLDPEEAAWSVQVEARVGGRLDEARLRAALGAVLGAAAGQRDALEVADCSADDALVAARARLQRMAVAVDGRPPLHALLARHPGGDVVMLNVNHAAADGLAALSVLKRIARSYAGDAGPVAPLEFLADRDLPVRPASPPTSIFARLSKRTVEALRDTVARTGRLAADGARDRPGYGFHTVALSAQETARVVGGVRAGSSGDVLLAALHRAIGDWNLQHGTPGRRIGVLVPANLRPRGWREERIGNFSVTARVMTSRRNRRGPAAAMRAVSAQTRRNKRTRTGIALIAGLERAGLVALWAKQSSVVLQPLTGNHLVDTAMLCNFGTIAEAPSFGAGAGETLELWLSTPARSPLTLCIGAVTVAGRLHLTFRYPHRLFGPDAARRFAECHVEHVRSVAAAGGG